MVLKPRSLRRSYAHSRATYDEETILLAHETRRRRAGGRICAARCRKGAHFLSDKILKAARLRATRAPIAAAAHLENRQLAVGPRGVAALRLADRPMDKVREHRLVDCGGAAERRLLPGHRGRRCRGGDRAARRDHRRKQIVGQQLEMLGVGSRRVAGETRCRHRGCRLRAVA